VLTTRVMMNPPMTMEIDLASDGENRALDLEDSGTSYPRMGYEFPEDVLQIIFDCIGPENYLYVALVCKTFCALYKERCIALYTYHYGWYPMTFHRSICGYRLCRRSTCTLYQNAGASVESATFAMNADYNLFDKLGWRVYIISGAIRMNRPLVVEWMFSNGWFDYVMADKCAKMGLVEVILWMWVCTFPFLDEKEDEYDPTLLNYFWVKGDIWSLNIQAIINTYDRLLCNKTFFVCKVYSCLRESY
jgi:hypothetical protein